MMIDIRVLHLLGGAEPARRLHTAIPHETHVFAVATITVVESRSFLGLSGPVSILATLADFSFALAQAFAETLAIRHNRLDIDLDIGWIMTEVAPLAESAIAMLLKVETRLLCTAILMIS
jgi:hypothetical protein